jgi:F-type H+-transporting ATPase subunit gamma
MAQLIHMRNRIRTIETIHKITHAMRLISMSHHARLKHKEDGLQKYVHELNSLFLKVKSQAPAWQDDILYPATGSGNHLLIIVGSQKGLCGAFNTILFKFMEYERIKMYGEQTDLITIGKRAYEHVQDHAVGPIVQTIEHLSYKNIPEAVGQIMRYLKLGTKRYDHVTVFANYPKSFFMQVPQAYRLVPFLQENEQTMAELSDLMQDYSWEQPPQDILPDLGWQCFQATIHTLLFQSLLAEQSARFLSMDGATRNAKSLLESTRLQYNKLRQAKITREIVELSEVR